jgi:single-strand selective monofunctional uracil DNA glycosylase
MGRLSRATALARIYRDLSRELRSARFGAPVSHVYDPLEYARAPFELYLKRYADGPREVVMLGMNPGPFGMAQTGIPFGEVELVRSWLRLEAHVGRPDREHPKRPVQGFACARSEVSGARLWGWARQRFGEPRAFLGRVFVANYCPLLFVEDSGRNRTPDKLPRDEREPLLASCDAALRHAIGVLEPRLVLGVGRFAEKRARSVLGDAGVEIDLLPHPSPASPLANRGWAPLADEVFERHGITLDA